jgi:hypothetical protein
MASQVRFSLLFRLPAVYQPPTILCHTPIDVRACFPDLSAAKHADVLFVKEKSDGENDLATYCAKENILHVLFSDFSKALSVVRSIVEGDKTPKEWFGIGRA